MIHSDIPLSRRITSKSLAASGRVPGSVRWTQPSLCPLPVSGPGPQSPPGKHIHPLPRHLLPPGEERATRATRATERKGCRGRWELVRDRGAHWVRPVTEEGEEPRANGGGLASSFWLSRHCRRHCHRHCHRLLPFTLSTHPLSCPRSRLSSFSPDNLSIVITITSTQCFQQRAGCSRRGGHLPFAFIALSRVTD